jgi:hypothetical protein
VIDAIGPGGAARSAFASLTDKESQYISPYFPDLYPVNYGGTQKSD